MAQLVSKPEKEWEVELKCKGGCGYTYKYNKYDVYKDSFKVSGYHFDGSAVCKEKCFVKCGNCEKIHFVSPPLHIRIEAERDY